MNAKSISIFLLKLLIASGIIYFLCKNQKIEDFQRIFEIPLSCIILILILYFGQLSVGSWRWKKLLEIQNVKISFYSSFILCVQSVFYSLVIPGGALGGDLVKTSLICKNVDKGMRLEPALSIFIDRVIGMMALFLMILLFAPFILYSAEALTFETKFILTLLLPICLGGFLAGFIFFFHRFFEQFLLTKLLFKYIHKWGGERFERILQSFDLYRDSMPKILFYILISMLFVHLPTAIIISTLIYGLGFTALIPAVLFAGLAGNAAAVIPLSLGGFGFREATIYFLLIDLALLPSVECKTVILTFALCILSMTLIGGLTLFCPLKFEHRNS